MASPERPCLGRTPRPALSSPCQLGRRSNEGVTARACEGRENLIRHTLTSLPARKRCREAAPPFGRAPGEAREQEQYKRPLGWERATQVARHAPPLLMCAGVPRKWGPRAPPFISDTITCSGAAHNPRTTREPGGGGAEKKQTPPTSRVSTASRHPSCKTPARPTI